MNQTLEEIVTSGYCTSEKGEHIDVSKASISREEGAFLQGIINEIKPKYSLEVGLAYGVSSLYICDALSQCGGSHIIIDPKQHEHFDGVGLHNVKKGGFGEKVEFLEEFSYDALPKLLQRGQKLQFAFIDGWHTFDYTLLDFFFIDRMLDVGGVVVFDDANWISVRKVCRYLATNLNYSVYKCLSDTMPSGVEGQLHAKGRTSGEPKGIQKILSKFLKPDVLVADWKLGLSGSCIAFRKEKEDDRRWDFHQEF